MGVSLRLPPEIIGRIVAHAQPRHNPSLNSERTTVFRALSLIGRDWYYYAKEEYDRWLVLSVADNARQSYFEAGLRGVDLHRVRFVRVVHLDVGFLDNVESRSTIDEVYEYLIQLVNLEELSYELKGEHAAAILAAKTPLGLGILSFLTAFPSAYLL